MKEEEDFSKWLKEKELNASLNNKDSGNSLANHEGSASPITTHEGADSLGELSEIIEEISGESNDNVQQWKQASSKQLDERLREMQARQSSYYGG